MVNLKSMIDLRYAIQDTESMIRIGKADLVEYKKQLKSLTLELKARCHPSYFELVDTTPVSENPVEQNVIEYKDSYGNLIQKWAKFWGVWKQYDDKGEVVMIWQGPCKNSLQAYPESIKQRFLRFNVIYRPEGTEEPTTLENYEAEYERYLKNDVLLKAVHAVKIDRSFKDPAIKDQEHIWKRTRGRLGQFTREHPDAHYDGPAGQYYNICKGCNQEMKDRKYDRMPEDGLCDPCRELNFMGGAS